MIGRAVRRAPIVREHDDVQPVIEVGRKLRALDEFAKQMLRDHGGNIQAIAERVGCESQPAFNRAFKRLTGSPPAVWRRAAARVAWER
jgi:transcriptional regulator GlxA family with amidase domain